MTDDGAGGGAGDAGGPGDRAGIELVRGPGSLAFDEALVRALNERALAPGAGGGIDGAPADDTAAARPRLWLWHTGPAVLLGRNQDVSREAFLDPCRDDGVAVLRRCSGGGAVYTDPGNPNISLVLPGSVLDPIGVLGGVMRAALAEFGIAATTTRRGVFVDGRKISGFAALRLARATLVHCTLLVDTPADTIWRYLRPAPEAADRFDSHRSPVTCLGTLLGAVPARDAVRAVVTGAFADAFGPVVRRPPDAAERDWEARLRTRRYDREEWHLTGKDARRTTS